MLAQQAVEFIDGVGPITQHPVEGAAVAGHREGTGLVDGMARERLQSGAPHQPGLYRLETRCGGLRRRWCDRIRYAGRTLLTPRTKHCRLVNLPHRWAGLLVRVKRVWGCVVEPLLRLLPGRRAAGPG